MRIRARWIRLAAVAFAALCAVMLAMQGGAATQ